MTILALDLPGPRRSPRQGLVPAFGLSPAGLMLVFFFALPMGMMIGTSFHDPSSGALSFQAYERFLNDGLTLKGFWRTAIMSCLVAVAATALFAMFHGVAHGLELPEMSSPWGYALGFVGATAALHAAGYAVVRLLPTAAAPVVRIAGALSAATGVWLFAG